MKLKGELKCYDQNDICSGKTALFPQINDCTWSSWIYKSQLKFIQQTHWFASGQIRVHTFMASLKNYQICEPLHPQKWILDLFFKKQNTWQISTPLPLPHLFRAYTYSVGT